METILERCLQKIKSDYGTVDARGVMQVRRIVALPLDEVFISLTAKLEGIGVGWLPHSRATERLARGDFGQRDSESKADPLTTDDLLERSLFEERWAREETGLSLDDLWKRNERWVLLGDPGAGKTTVWKHLAWQQAKVYESDDPGLLPIPVTLRFFAKTWSDNPAWRPGEAIMKYLAGSGAAEWGFEQADEQTALAELFDHALQNKRALLLFDGLDEQRDAQTKQRTVEAVQQLLMRYPGNRCLVTSRIVGYDAAPLGGGFTKATLEPFTDEQMRRFFHNWMYAIERREDIVDDASTKSRAERKAQDLIEQVKAHPGVRTLAANPLLCTIIGLIHHQGGTLPSQRVELYKLCIDTFIFSWEIFKRGKRMEQDGLNKDETQAVLEEIALYFQEHCPENRATRNQLLDITRDFLVREQGFSKVAAQQQAEKLLFLIREVGGLLIDRGGEEYGFFHLTFQEYLAARAITRRRGQIDHYLCQYLFNPRWREVIRLAAAHQGMKDEEAGSEFIQAILNRRHEREDVMHYAFRMAFLCASEARVELKTSDALFRRWIELYLDPSYAHLHVLLLRLFRRPGGKIRYRPDTINRLINTLRRDHDPIVREQAAQALGKVGDAGATDALRQASRLDENHKVRQRAAFALIVNDGPQALKQDDPFNRFVADWMGMSGNPRFIPYLLQMLRDHDPLVRQSAAVILGSINDSEAVKALQETVKDQNWGVRISAAVSLGMLRHPSALTILQQLLLDQNDLVREKAAISLGMLHDVTTIPSLSNALTDQNEEVRFGSAIALGKMGDPKGLDALQQMLQDRSNPYCNRAAIELADMGNQTVIPYLLLALREPDKRVRHRAAEVLERIDLGSNL
jgi:HEAT repeat protein